jgi:hypothetical protein
MFRDAHETTLYGGVDLKEYRSPERTIPETEGGFRSGCIVQFEGTQSTSVLYEWHSQVPAEDDYVLGIE